MRNLLRDRYAIPVAAGVAVGSVVVVLAISIAGAVIDFIHKRDPDAEPIDEFLTLDLGGGHFAELYETVMALVALVLVVAVAALVFRIRSRASKPDIANPS